MSTVITVTEKEMDEFLKVSKGWVKQISGYEYVYDYAIPRYPIVVKALSTIPTPDAIRRNRGSSVIRIYAVKVDVHGKVISGLMKSIKIRIAPGWKSEVYETVISVIQKTKKMIG